MSSKGYCRNLVNAVKKLITPLSNFSDVKHLPKPHCADCEELRNFVKEISGNNYVPKYHIDYNPDLLVSEIGYNYDPYGEHVYIYLK